MTNPEVISIIAICVALITFFNTHSWNYRNKEKDLKKDTLLNVSGALNRQTQLIIKMADANVSQADINKVLSENEFIFGQMFTAASARTSKVVLNYLAELAETFFELSLKKNTPDSDQLELFSYALSKHAKHMVTLPFVIAEIKVELGIKGGVIELEDAIKTGCELMNRKIIPLINNAKN